MKDVLENAGQLLALLLSACAIVGLAAKYVVQPWLEDRFAPLERQVQETHHQVTVNGHVSEEPTLKDRVDTMRAELRELKGETRRDLSDMRQDIHTVGRLYDRHMDWSAREAAQLWAALIALRDGVITPEDEGNPADDERNEDD